MSVNDIVKTLHMFDKKSELPIYESCFKPKLTRAIKPLKYHIELVHTVVWGPSQEPSIVGSRYVITFIHDSSCIIWIYFMKNKSGILQKFLEFKSIAENQCNRKTKL